MMQTAVGLIGIVQGNLQGTSLLLHVDVRNCYHVHIMLAQVPGRLDCSQCCASPVNRRAYSLHKDVS